MSKRKIVKPFMIIFELLYLGVAWIMAMIYPPFSQRMVDWAMKTLPDSSWYNQ